MTPHMLKQPYVIFLGDVEEAAFAKTGFGLLQWRKEACIAQLRFDGCRVDLGLPDISVDDLKGLEGSLIVGVAAPGGTIAEHWVPALVSAAEFGLDVVAGTHTLASDIPSLKRAADRSGARLIDVRVSPSSLPIATGNKRSGNRLLTVGTDCAVGKKYTALALEREMIARDVDVKFRASGQTGILIAGSGIAIDTVVCDFTAGAAELLSPDADKDHWDVIEGQGSLFHPSYAGVSLGLLHGSQPDAIVLCHDAARTTIAGLEGFTLPTLLQSIELNVACGRRTNADIQCVGISVNTSGVSAEDRDEVLIGYEQETGLPCVDPLVEGVGRIVDRLFEDAT